MRTTVRACSRRLPGAARLLSTDNTFVSKHYSAPAAEMQRVLEALPSRHRRSSGKYEVQICDFCDKGNKRKESNQWKLCINDDGSYHCFRCAVHGSWFDLKRLVLGSPGPGPGSNHYSTANKEIRVEAVEVNQVVPGVLPDQGKAFAHTKRLFAAECDTSKETLDYLTTVRGLSLMTLQRYGVGCATMDFLSDDDKWERNTCITFPWMDRDDHDARVADGIDGVSSSSFKIKRLKYRALTGKGKQRLDPKGGEWGFFGWHVVRDTDDSVVITEGEFDAMAVAQSLSMLTEDHPLRNLPAISLPNGCGSLPPALLPRLERFKNIYLWMDNDSPGIVAAEKFSRKLGLKRCFIVKPLQSDAMNAPKDANDALRNGASIVDMLQAARLLEHKRLNLFSDFRGEVLGHFKDPENQEHGTPTPSLPTLTSLTKGFREGELVIFTGPTGSGKTTMLSQLTLDFAKEGAPTLWGSFEIKNTRLLQSMLKQFHPKELLELITPEKLDRVADKFEALPLVFMNFHGGSNLDEVLEAMDYAVYQHDIKHIVLDNLQFMMSNQGKGGIEKFDYQDRAISAFRKFCSEKMVNIILVIHPRKDDDRLALHVSSIFGTAKATQEADLVIILQKMDDHQMFVDIKKNRFDGQLGKFDVNFNSMSKLFYEP
jgi:twinkle protein